MKKLVFGVLTAGLVLTQPACTPAAAPVAAPPSATATDPAPAASPSPSSSSSPSPSATTKSESGSSGSPLSGRRQVVIRPNPSTESIVAVDAKGRLTLTDGQPEHSLFVFSPVGGKYQIKTATAGTGGEPDCMGVKSNGSAPLTVVATACDTSRAGQLFDVARQKKNDAQGRPTYTIANQGAFLQERPTGLIAEELGDSPLETTFSLVDNGPSTLPSLD
ncbi:hypothetical protein [Actinoplanes sp. NPDC049265]|uniref:hypothetical protein n=1 Tax=Actinoplanes sp. NPDC049265 TaxID=3363902 RepID=UPI00371BC7D5